MEILARAIRQEKEIKGIQSERKGFPGGSAVKTLPAMQKTKETQVQSLGQEGLLEEEMATHFNILAWKILWTESMGSKSQT